MTVRYYKSDDNCGVKPATREEVIAFLDRYDGINAEKVVSAAVESLGVMSALGVNYMEFGIADDDGCAFGIAVDGVEV